jgi:hypothetical protein
VKGGTATAAGSRPQTVSVLAWDYFPKVRLMQVEFGNRNPNLVNNCCNAQPAAHWPLFTALVE